MERTPIAPYPISPAGLAAAIENRDQQAVEQLLRAGVDACARAPSRNLPLLTIAAEVGDAAIVRALIRCGADPGGGLLQVSADYSPLTAAILQRHIDCITVLLESGLGADQTRLDAALAAAVGGGHPDLVQMFLERGANPCASSGRCNTILSVAAREFDQRGTLLRSVDPRVLKLILRAMPTPEERRIQIQRALRCCIYEWQLLATRFLLDQAPDIYDEPEDQFHERPLEAAAAAGNVHAAKLIRSYGPCSPEARKQ